MILTNFGSIPSSGGSLWLDGWSYGKKITIPANSIDADLTDFPATVYLNNSNFDFTKAKADGSDIRFTDKNLNHLKFERKQHSSSTMGVYNVQIPTVSDLTDTEIYMWYGNANAYNTSIEAWQDQTGKQLTYNGNVKLVHGVATGKRVASFDGSGDYFTVPDSDGWYLNGNFTLEYIYTPNAITEHYILHQRYDAQNQWYFGYNGTGFNFSQQVLNTVNINTTATYAIQAAQTYHVALTKVGNDYKWWVNGTQVGSTYTNATALTDWNAVLTIGCYASGAYYLNGYLKSLRITKGRARYTSNFTPPTTFSIDGSDVVFCTNFDTIYDTNYVMVQHMGDTLVDASGNGNNGTATGTTVVNTDYGKARSFNGSSEYIKYPDNAFNSHDVGTLINTFSFPDKPAQGMALSLFASGSSSNIEALFNYQIYGVTSVDSRLRYGGNLTTQEYAYGHTSLQTNTNYVATFRVGSVTDLFIDATKQTKTYTDASDLARWFSDYVSGTMRYSTGTIMRSTGNIAYYKGNISESRLSNIARTDAWIKAESLALKNSLLSASDIGVDVPDGGTATADNYVTWLACAGLADSFGSITNVVASPYARGVLCNSKNALKYMVRSSTIGAAVLANSSWIAEMDTCPYSTHIPTMTSDTAPSGTVTVGPAAIYQTRYGWKAFDKSIAVGNAYGTIGSGTDHWVRYQFPQNLYFYKVADLNAGPIDHKHMLSADGVTYTGQLISAGGFNTLSSFYYGKYYKIEKLINNDVYEVDAYGLNLN